MPREGKKNILTNLTDFVDKLFARMADESPEGRDAFLALLDEANIKYNKPKTNFITGWFYLYTRQRDPEMKLAKNSISKFTDAYTRLQEFKILIAKGEWETTSLNYYIFTGLIASIPGYNPLKSSDIPTAVSEIREQILEKIDPFMRDYEANQKLIERKKQELAATHQSEQIPFGKILLANNLEAAKASAVEHPDKIQFCLLQHNNKWNVYWLDINGMEYLLRPGKELLSLLEKHNNVLNPDYEKPLKKECLKARDEFLDKNIELQINPRGKVKVNGQEVIMDLTDAQLIERGFSKTFILRGKSNAYTLCWINTLEQVQEISLADHPQLQSWLHTQNALTQDELPQLKSYLLKINVTKALGVAEDFKNNLAACLGRKLPPVPTAAPPPVPIVEVKPASKKLNMTLFAGVVNHLNAVHGKKPTQAADSIAVEAPPVLPSDHPPTIVADVPTAARIEGAEVKPQKTTHKKLNMGQFGAVSQLFGHKAKNEHVADAVTSTELPTTGINTQ